MENSHEDSEIFSRSDTLHPVNYVDIVTFLLYVCFYSNDTVFDESIKKIDANAPTASVESKIDDRARWTVEERICAFFS